MKLSKDDLICVVCHEDLNHAIYQCLQGPHYVCEKCAKKLKQCPTCRHPFPLVNNIALKRSLDSIKQPCSDCKQIFFPWSLAEHRESCIAAPTKCPFCEVYVKSFNLLPHFERECRGKLKCVKIPEPSKDIILNPHDFSAIQVIHNKRSLLFVSYPSASERVWILGVADLTIEPPSGLQTTVSLTAKHKKSTYTFTLSIEKHGRPAIERLKQNVCYVPSILFDPSIGGVKLTLDDPEPKRPVAFNSRWSEDF